MFAQSFGWKKCRAKKPGRCFICLSDYAAGSAIAWLVATGLTKCSYCADGTDREYGRLPKGTKRSIDEHMDNVRRLINFPMRSSQQEDSLKTSAEYLRNFRQLRSVRRFLQQRGL